MIEISINGFNYSVNALNRQKFGNDDEVTQFDKVENDKVL